MSHSRKGGGFPKAGKSVTILSYSRGETVSAKAAKIAVAAQNKIVAELPRLKRKYGFIKDEIEKTDVETNKKDDLILIKKSEERESSESKDVMPQASRRSVRVPKRKRFESEEQNQAPLNPGKVEMKKPKEIDEDQCKTPNKQGQDIAVPDLSKNSSNTNNTLKKQPVTREFFQAKEFAAAVVVLMEPPPTLGVIVVNYEKYAPESGFLQCGICRDVAEITKFTQHKKFGSFMCSSCISYLTKMINISKKALGLNCLGKGVCEIKPKEKHCEACFSRNCLLFLDIESDVYFKLYRAIPPIARNDLPEVPSTNKPISNNGKVIYVNRENGNVVHISSAVPKNTVRKTLRTSLKSEIESVLPGQGLKYLLPNLHGDPPMQMFEGRVKQVVRHIFEDERLPDAIEIRNEAKNSGAIGTEDGEPEPGKMIKLFPVSEVLGEQGYPVVVNSEGGQEPPKPLCHSCGSAGINQMIFCCACSEPFHPYCSEDELLLATYLAHSSSYTQVPIETLRRKFRKWKCHRCLSCSQCGKGGVPGKENDFVGCSLCFNSFHVKCTKKMPLRPTERDKWVCSSCLQCTSCGVPLTKSSHHLRKFISETETQPDILCLECFRRRQKGSFCPVCFSCYDDNDWDSKMMECDKCQRWIHAQCEGLNEEKYFILSSLPEAISYICRLCIEPCNVGWRLAVETELHEGCAKILDLFHKKAVGMSRKRRALSFEVEDLNDTLKTDESDLNYFTPNSIIYNDNDRVETPSNLDLSLLKVSSNKGQESPTKIKPANISPKLDDLIEQYKIKPCVIRLVDMSPIVKASALECSTPVKMNTPNRVLTSFTEAVKSTSSLWGSVRDFRNISLKLLPTYFEEMTCTEKYEGQDRFVLYFEDTIKQVFPWWRDGLQVCVKKIKDLNDNIEDTSSVTTEDLDEAKLKDDILPDSIPFQDIYWDEQQFMDHRKCALCCEIGDFPFDSLGRLLYVNPEEWVHVNCAIWSSEVWEEDDGALQQVETALLRGKKSVCSECTSLGATLNCCAGSCQLRFHFLCAVNAAACVLQMDKSVFCSLHSNSAKGQVQSHMHVMRKVFVGEKSKRKDLQLMSNNLKLFVGFTRVDRLGRLVPISVIDSHNLLLPVNFHIGFGRLASPTSENPDRKWILLKSHTFLNKEGDFRSRNDIENDEPTTSNFNIVVNHSKHKSLVQMKLKDAQEFWEWSKHSTKFIDEFNMEWSPVFKPSSRKKKKQSFLKEQKTYRTSLEWKAENPLEKVSDQVMNNGLSHPRLRFLLEQLPGMEYLGSAYKFQHFIPSRFPEDIPVTPTISGSSRSEAFFSRKPPDMFSWLKSKHRKPPSYSTIVVSEESMKSKGLPIAMRYRILKIRANKDLLVLPSRIHGRGLFTKRDMTVGEILIEYAGELIRSSLCDIRERKYEQAGIGCYMFRVNRDLVVDATMKGNAARFINHSCDPNCESRVHKILGKDHIFIFALKSIANGEELTYDYKFERETDKLPCSCNTRRCRRFLN